MSRLFRRRTIRTEVVVTGRALHGGQPVTVTLKPHDGGFRFRYGEDEVQALACNVVDTERCTQLGNVSTIEHLMSACAGLGVSDLVVSCTQPELPGLDGSSIQWFNRLCEAGVDDLGELEIPGFEGFELNDIRVEPGTGKFRYILDYGDRWPEQVAEFNIAKNAYGCDIAPARTIVMEEELPHVKRLGLGQGLDETSVLGLGRGEYLNTPRFANEPARHKLLDLIGDLALSGVPMAALDVVSKRGGHTSNVAAALELGKRVGLL